MLRHHIAHVSCVLRQEPVDMKKVDKRSGVAGASVSNKEPKETKGGARAMSVFR